MKSAANFLSAGTTVRVAQPGVVPAWSTWDDDRQRSSPSVKKRLQTLFFRGDRRISSQIVYIGSETVRERLKKKNQVKVELRDAAGSHIVITADAGNLMQG